MDDLAERVAANVKAREAASEIIKLIDEEVAGYPDRAKEVLALALFEHIHPMLIMHLIFKPDRNLPMTVVQAKAFRRSSVPYGEFRSQSVDCVPLDRLRWYADQRFTDDLRRYLASDLVRNSPKAREVEDET